MKKLLLLGLLLISTLSFGQIKIEPIAVGWPAKTATQICVKVLTFETTDKSCQLYYAVKTEDGEKLADGNISLTEEEFDAWGIDNVYIEDLAIWKLNLTRKIEE